MSELIVVIFDNQYDAGKLREALAEDQQEGSLPLASAAIVLKDKESNINMQYEINTDEAAGVGNLLGLLISFMFAGSLASIIIGTADRKIVGSLAGLGIEKQFVTDVVKSLQPDSSALFVIVQDAYPAIVLAALRHCEGKLFQTAIPAEAEEKLWSMLRSRI